MERSIIRMHNMIGLLSLSVILLSTFHAGHSQEFRGECDITCEEITDPLCHFAVYTYTGFPNLLGHTKQGYIQQYDHLIEVLELCYSNSMEFLCGILAPHCVEGKGLMLPTRKMCEDFHEGCDEFLEEAGTFQVDCSLLPEMENDPPRCIHFPTAPPGLPMHTFPPPTEVVPYCEEDPNGSGFSFSYSITLLMAATFTAVFVVFYHHTC